jgi:ATP adenylyltransferase
MENLFTPWRYAYISSAKPSTGCFLCEAASEPDDAERLVVHLGRYHVVLLNRYPYTNGHLMIAPREHIASPDEASAESQAELWPLVLEAQRVLSGVYSPDGFNIGMNVGRAAGAGVPDHFHLHIVPRWSGDTNFMSVVGGVRLVPEEPRVLRDRLAPLFGRQGQGAHQ